MFVFLEERSDEESQGYTTVSLIRRTEEVVLIDPPLSQRGLG